MIPWALILIAVLVVVGFPLAFRWRARHTGHAAIRRRWVATDGPRCIGHYGSWQEAGMAAKADAEEQP